MAKNVLPVDFQDDILTEDMDGRRRYQMITNADGTVSFVDVTEYTQVGSNFGQAQINATNEAVNESADKNKIIDTKADLMANTQAGMIAGALAVKEIRSELNEKMGKTKVFNFSKDSIAANGADTMMYNVPDDFNEIINYGIIGNLNGSWITYGLSLDETGKVLIIGVHNFYQNDLSIAGGKLILYYR